MPIVSRSTGQRLLKAAKWTERERRSGAVGRTPRLRPGGGERGFYARITGASVLTTERWAYDWTKVIADPETLGDFIDADPAVTEATLGTARNLMEYGEGVFERDAIPTGTIVFLRFVGSGATRFPVFSAYEQAAEDCEAEEESALELSEYVGLLDTILVGADGEPLISESGGLLLGDGAENWPVQAAMLDRLLVGADGKLLSDKDGNLMHRGGVDAPTAGIINLILTDKNGDPLVGANGNLLIGALP